MYGYRTGAKQEHKNQIRQMAAQGKTPEEISRALLIDIKCVTSFVHHYFPERAPKPQPEVAPPQSEAKIPRVQSQPQYEPEPEGGDEDLAAQGIEDDSEVEDSEEDEPQEMEKPRVRRRGRPARKRVQH